MLEPAQHFIPTHLRHQHIEQDQVEGALGHDGKRFCARGRSLDRMAIPRELTRQKIAV
jgi:hypothetical protein